tara:strand:+ start:2126 stop:3316 length:1191 start_codon:yes stop_codon:yes gene_type:complete
MNIENITIIGSGYVGLALAVSLSKKYSICINDIDEEKVIKLNQGLSPLDDNEFLEKFKNINPKIIATNSIEEALKKPQLVFICLPTDFDEEVGRFDTTIIEGVLDEISRCKLNPLIVIKSTVPVGFVEKQNKIFQDLQIIFSPEFLREGSAISDCEEPSRIILGGDSSFNQYEKIFDVLLSAKKSEFDVATRVMSSSEAEAVKLFSNTYLAMRVAFFNELDSFSIKNSLSAKNIIDGVSDDQRIGDHYNNPSFGYGGYCLPKDTKQLISDSKDSPSKLIASIVESNQERKKFLAAEVSKKKYKTIGVHRMTMKKGSSNFRESSILDIIKFLDELNKEVVIYEPLLDDSIYLGKYTVYEDQDTFFQSCDIVLSNRVEEIPEKYLNKIYTRDIFNTDR